MFKALSDEARLRLLNLIVKFGEMCISDLELVLDFTQTKSSRHLIYLKHSALLNVRKKGQWTFYYLNPKYSQQIVVYIGILNSDPTLKNDIQTYNILFSNRELAAYKMTQRKYPSSSNRLS
ncbi:MAG: metalloregulator ArsR/SmtB family transcription factor [Opitutaceae bacterium]|nr:metalloregulator ArsR/SmtB family transcription factor [Cytophagales bacterium]